MFKNIYGWLDNNKKRYKSELEYRKIVDNIIWIIAGRFVRLGLGVIVASLVARHLGPLDYGRIVYVIAFVGLFSAFASFGLNGVVVRELVKSTENYGNILGASVVIQLIAGMISIVIITSGFFYSNDFSDQNLLFVGATILLFRVSDVIKYWYESQVLTKNVVMVETVSYFLVAIISIILIINNSHVIMFVLVTSVEGLIVLLLLFYMYSRSGYRISNWKVRYGEIKYLIYECWPLVISGTLVMVNMGIDRVFLGAMADSAQLGLYAAANLFVGAFFFIPTALIGTLAPKLIAQHGKSIGSFHSQAGKLFSNVGAVLLSIVIAISIFSGDIINLVFGEHYFGAGKVLAISCWSILFVFQVSLRGRLLIIEGRQKELSMLISLGTFTNVLLNYFLIPHYGAVGAAYAFSISWFASALVFPAIFINTRKYILMCFGVTPNL